ncbi:HlyD family secretion protein [Erythrobacter dokdonensis]|jgi:multidrug resistance efflux pump|uniref:RND efflux membrane fusion protein n=1 Tax=Erythrobacter dokdonensis DSW-74 TaxID=1300349 RepID=A0A1A7BF69_9SPHN|nr:HlyD family efflux transporter periplasmic adaptor subunit [Erythrobacter dokdonensis]MEE4318127.1 HlyD family efflux transporter periplasmic adaptor subunit [Erythrobacter sp.]OBV10391.1 RND efflux membrane fusion protein [Erythrobacter dokdonensis DSW-74]
MSALQRLPHRFTALESVKIPRVMRTVFYMLLVAFLSALVFLIYAPWVQTATGRGQVNTLNPNERKQDINALVPGRIEEWYVRDGSAIKAGDPIVRIADIDPQLIERLQAERQQVQLQLQAAQSALATARLDERRARELFEAGLAARRDFEQAQIRIAEMEGRVAAAQANLNRADVNLSRQSVQIVRAPRDGFIQSLNAGDAATYINAGDVLATFVPDGAERVVEIFIDGRDVALVKRGDKARVMFEGWPAVQFSGWPSVAVGTFGGIVVAVDQSAQPNGRFRVLIAEDKADAHPWPEERFVRFGAKAQAWVLLETVPVGYEIWRQLNNFPPELPPGETAAAGE